MTADGCKTSKARVLQLVGKTLSTKKGTIQMNGPFQKCLLQPKNQFSIGWNIAFISETICSIGAIASGNCSGACGATAT